MIGLLLSLMIGGVPEQAPPLIPLPPQAPPIVASWEWVPRQARWIDLMQGDYWWGTLDKETGLFWEPTQDGKSYLQGRLPQNAPATPAGVPRQADWLERSYQRSFATPVMQACPT